MISIQVDTRPLKRWLSDIEKEQLPFATAKALTVTAAQAKKAVDAQLPKKLDRPRPFTRLAIGIKAARKTQLQSDVFVKDKQAEYLKYAIEGGTRRPKKSAIATPGSKVRLNKYGNMPGARGKAGKLLANKAKYFSGVPRGHAGAPAGIWQRMGKGGRGNIRLVVQYKKQITYKKRLPFRKIVEGVVAHRWRRNFEQAFADAMRTAR